MSTDRGLRLRTLGPVGLTRPDGSDITAVLSQPKRLVLLVYLAVANRGALCRRDTVLGVFWPEFDQERARAALRKALHFLRRELGEGVIVTRGDEEIGVDADRLPCDVLEFDTAVAKGAPERALSLYRGEFLAGLHLNRAAEFERWVDSVRAERRDAAIRVAREAADGCRSRGEVPAGAEWTKHWTRLDPTNETATRQLMACHLELGDRVAALGAFKSLVSALHDLDLEPSAETQAAAASARAPLPSATGPAPAQPFPTATPSPPSSRRTGTLVAAAVLMVLVAAAFMSWGGVSAVDERPTIIVTDFENRTGDVGLEVVGSVYQQRIAAFLTPMGRLRVLPVNDTAALASFTVRGSFRFVGAAGDTLEFNIEIQDNDRQQILPAPEPVRTPRDHPTDPVDRLGARIASAMGYYLSYWAPTRPQHRPPEPDVYRAFQDALREVLRWGDYNEKTRARADSLLRYVIGRDPLYTEAYLLLGGFVIPVMDGPATHQGEGGQYGRYDLVDSLVQTMQARITPMSETDQFSIDYLSWLAAGNYAKAMDAVLRIVPVYPELVFRAAMLGVVGNQPTRALEAISRLDPETTWVKEFWNYWFFRFGAHHVARDYTGEQDAVGAAASVIPRPYILARVRAAAALGQVDTVRALTQNLGLLLALRGGLEVRAHGIERQDPDLIAEGTRMLTWVEAWYDEDPTEWYHGWIGHWILPFASRTDEHVQNLKTMVRERPDRLDVKGMLGVAYARAKNRAAADSIDAVLAHEDPTQLRGLISLWRARIAARLGQRNQAVALLEQALREGTWVHPAFPGFSSYWHTDPDFELLWGDPAYEQLVAPR